MDANLNAEQIAYYRARAGEYDEWFYRAGRYDRGAENNARWFKAVAEVQTAVRALGAVDEILELACGTGIWTEELARLGRHVTAIDAAPEVLAINAARVGSANVTYQQHDLFAWQPERRYDLVFFAFWLSHVPPAARPAFFATVAAALKPGGSLCIVDSLPDPTSTAANHAAPDPADIYHTRKLNDGRSFTVVKVFDTPDSLRHSLADAGFRASVQPIEPYFLCARATIPGS